jgi:hypothetical protein
LRLTAALRNPRRFLFKINVFDFSPIKKGGMAGHYVNGYAAGRQGKEFEKESLTISRSNLSPALGTPEF